MPYGREHLLAIFLCVPIFAVEANVAFALEPISESETITAVSGKVFNGYSRPKQADGSFKPETYAFGNGGFVATRLGALHDATVPTFMRDDTVDAMTFEQVAATVKASLSAQRFSQSHDPEQTNLLIMVFWGLTVGGSNFAGPDRDKVNQINASLLGYDPESFFSEARDLAPRASIMREVHAGILSSIEPNRYWVVLRAFDFQSSWKQKQLKLLWETRFSLSQRRHDFGKDLPEMASVASHYFGQDTHGLISAPLPEGHVEIGGVKSLGEVQKPGTEQSNPASQP